MGITCSDRQVTEIAAASVRAVSDKPHGIFGVDMAYDKRGVPNPTEINISRFFTTVRFFTQAGINFPETFKRLALGETLSIKKDVINPLKNGLIWVSGMDRDPLLTTNALMDQEINFD